MVIRIGALLLGWAFAPALLTAQAAVPSQTARTAVYASTQSTPATPAADARLTVSRAEVERAVREQPSASVDVVTRPRWHYPAIGAAIGIAAGVIHARAVMQGDYMGFPAEPMYLFPAAYGAVGAFLGVLIDSAERERAAAR